MKTRSTYPYKNSKPLRPIFFQNHFSLHFSCTINAFKLPEPLTPTIVGLSGSVQSTKAYEFLKYYKIKIVCFSTFDRSTNTYKFLKPLTIMIVFEKYKEYFHC